MGFSFSIKVDQVKRAFEQLPKAVAKKVIRHGLRKGAKIVQAIAKREAPTDTGQTQKAIKVRAGKKKRNAIRINIQVGAGDYRGDTFYAPMVELGHFAGPRRLGNKRKWVPPVGFMRKAKDLGERPAQQAASQDIKAGIDREVSALNRGK